MLRGLTPLVLEAERGRLRVRLVCLRLGDDLCVTLSGGDREHVGAVALARPGADPQALAVPGHREEDLAKRVAARLSAHCRATVCVACGIHLDRIAPAEIQDALDLSARLAEELAGRMEGPEGTGTVADPREERLTSS